MKTIQIKLKTVFLLLMLGFAFVSCSSDDDAPKDEVQQDQLIVGQWFFETTESEFPETDCERDSYLEFNEDKTAFGIIFRDGPEGGCTPFLATNYTFKLTAENTIQFTVIDDNGDEGEVFSSKIVSVSENKLVLKSFAFMTGNVELKK